MISVLKYISCMNMHVVKHHVLQLINYEIHSIVKSKFLESCCIDYILKANLNMLCDNQFELPF